MISDTNLKSALKVRATWTALALHSILGLLLPQNHIIIDPQIFTTSKLKQAMSAVLVSRGNIYQ